MTKINYFIGDATNVKEGVIVHICNDERKWGAGFVLALSKKWSQPEYDYRNMNDRDLKLGNVQMVKVEDKLFVANVIGQRSTMYNEFNVPPIRYEAVEVALNKIAEYCLLHDLEIHAPRLGCGLAGGSWEIMELIINKTLIRKEVKVTVYDFPGGKYNV